MYASEFIAKLQHLINVHGDLPIYNEYGHIIGVPEYNTDDGACILVTFEAE